MTTTRERIRAVALARPCDLGEPGTRWSLTRLRRYLDPPPGGQGRSPRSTCAACSTTMGITAQRTRTWKWSNDPLYEQKKQWVLGAYKAAEAGTLDGVLVSFDECGPISLKPHPGSGLVRPKRPARELPLRSDHRLESGSRSARVSLPCRRAAKPCG